MAALILPSLQSGALPGGLGHPWDKLAHFVAYAALAYALARATGSPWRGLLWAAWFGVFDEGVQAFAPARDSSFQDWLADLAGALAGSALAARALRPSVPGRPGTPQAAPPRLPSAGHVTVPGPTRQRAG